MTGTSIGAQTTVPDTGVSWGSARGAFMAGPEIFYGDTSGNFWKASFDGSTVGTPAAVDPYDDPAWDNVQTGSGQTYQGVKSGYYSELPNVTGAFYSDGRLYYSLSGQPSLRWRYFSPDSGTVGGQEFTVSGGNFASVAGMFLSGSTLYYANGADGTLHSVAFSNGGTNGTSPSVNPATDTTVSGPSIDGIDWRSRSLFAYGSATGPAQAITFTGSADAYVKSGTSATVTTPQAVSAGDTELLYVSTSNATAGAISTPPGWTQVTTQNSLPLQTAVFEKTAAAGDPGSAVTASVSSAGPLAVQLADYTNAGSAAPVTAGASDSATASHTAPAVSVASGGSWVVSFWADKSSSTTGWTLPGGVTQRDQVIGTGSGRVTAVIGDSNAGQPAGTYPAQTATVGGTASGKGAMISLVLAPQS